MPEKLSLFKVIDRVAVFGRDAARANTSARLFTLSLMGLSFFASLVDLGAGQMFVSRLELSQHFKIKLVAQEPLVESPVAFEWGADGKLWIAEMSDYPKGDSAGEGIAKGQQHNGRVVYLEDTHHRGIYDKSTVFLDGLDFPNGVFPWRNGVIVSAGGEILYAEDTNHTGKANFRKTILTGFNTGNPQHRLNGFEYGLDNWLYAANGDSGGRIQARREAFNGSLDGEKRIMCIRLLGRGLDRQEQDVKELGQFLNPQIPAPLQREAIGRLSEMQSTNAASVLISGWPGYTPDTRGQALEALISRPQWKLRLLDAIETGVIVPGQIPEYVQTQLLNSSQPQVKQRAIKIFASISRDRQKIIEQYIGVASLKGDPIRGTTLYQNNCAICHAFKRQGHAVGPNLETVADKPIDYLLTAILDPSRSIAPRYTCYNVETRDGREFTGVIASDTPNNITLVLPGGGEETVGRGDFLNFSSSKVSLMPDGFEKILNQQAMADLISYLRLSQSSPLR